MVVLLYDIHSFGGGNIFLNPLTVFDCCHLVSSAYIKHDWYFFYILDSYFWGLSLIIGIYIKTGITKVKLLKFMIFSNLTIVDQLLPRCTILILLVLLGNLFIFPFGIGWPLLSRLN